MGLSLPDLRALDWVTVRRPTSRLALPLIKDLGAGETEVLLLAVESADPIVILDDRLARRFAETLSLRITGTLGLLLDAKRAGLIESVAPLLNQLQEHRFRLAAHTRRAVLRAAAEAPD